MRKTLFAFLALSLMSSILLAASAKPDLDCELVTLKKIDVFLDQELQLSKKPVLKFEDSTSQWTLQIGKLILNTRKPEGYKLKKRSVKLHGQVREYSIWINNILTYQFEVDFSRQSLALYWWGTGRRSQLADFACEIAD